MEQQRARAASWKLDNVGGLLWAIHLLSGNEDGSLCPGK